MLNAILLIPLFTGFVFVLAGLVMLKFPPKNINGLYGYRTSSSMKNQQRWDFAQLYSSKEMIKTGVILMLSSLIGLINPTETHIDAILGLFLFIGATGSLFVRVERAVKKKFGELD